MPTPPTEPLLRETDGFTFVVLGLLSTLRRLDEQAARPASGPADREAPRRAGDETIHAGLGIRSLRRTLERWLEIAARAAPDDAPPRTPRAAPREILR
jgi:hypothetical protein